MEPMTDSLSPAEETVPTQPVMPEKSGYIPHYPPEPPFTASSRELLAAALSYVMAYFYFDSFWLAGLLLIGIMHILHRGTHPSGESTVWFACLLSMLVILRNPFPYTPLLGAWFDEEKLLFCHIFAVWWILSRSGVLLAGKSSAFLPADAFRGFILLPFSGFFLRIRTVAFGFKTLMTRRGTKRINPWSALAIVFSLGLFILAASLLMQADVTFGSIFADAAARLTELLPENLGEFFLTVLLSLPVGMYLYGLIARSFRMEKAETEKSRTLLEGFLAVIHRVPAGLWTAVICLFSALYLVFFFVQGSYLFGAFTRTLPEGFIVSQYAREGFFELCKVMAVNFALLALATGMVREEDARRPAFRCGVIAMLLESMLFAVIAFSKLGLYISCFGFTPLRLQSCWLICVLFAGCGLWLYSFLTGKKTFRLWMYFGAITLVLLAV